MTYKKIISTFCWNLMLVPSLTVSDELPGPIATPDEEKQIIKVDPLLLEQKTEFELNDSSDFKVISGFGAKMTEIRIFKSSDKKFDVGVTKIDKVTLSFHDWPIDEFVSVLEGSVEIIDQEKNVQIYESGDSFVIPKGFSGIWKQLSPVTMVTIFYSAESQNHHN